MLLLNLIGDLIAILIVGTVFLVVGTIIQYVWEEYKFFFWM